VDLTGWQLVGKGEVKVDEEQNGLILTEGADSKGITLESRKSYSRNVVVSFDVEPKSYEGINFVFLSASDKVTQGELKVPDDHEGNMEFWTDERVQNYIFAFHNGFYDSKPFIKKNPGLTDIARSNKLVSGKDSFSVEIGRKGRRLWIKVDGKTVVRGRDKARGGLPGGKRHQPVRADGVCRNPTRGCLQRGSEAPTPQHVQDNTAQRRHGRIRRRSGGRQDAQTR